MRTCFIIMPITTPENLLHSYSNDKDHFKHLLDHLFLPAIKAAGLDPIPPIAKGAELIHGEIIKNLELSDLVLCDMSILNPNVFFELGIRTALNKTVCLVRDDKTKTIPFDIGVINHHIYDSTLAPWTIALEVQKLSAHIEASLASMPNANVLWFYFSMSLRAAPTEAKGSIEDKVAYLNVQFEGLRRRLETFMKEATITAMSKKCSECSNIMYETIVDSWAGDSDGYQPRYVPGYKCSKCGYEHTKE